MQPNAESASDSLRKLGRAQRTLREAVELAEESAEHPAFGEVVDQVNPGAR